MIEQMRYTNHVNESLEFGTGSLFVNESDLHNFAWSVTSKNDRISGFRKGIVSKTIPVILKCNTEAEGIALRNKLFEVCEKDILAVKHGKLIIGDYYLKCYVTESKKSNYLLNDGYMTISVKISTDFPYWIKESTTKFGYGGETGGGTSLDFNRDFPYDYSSNMLDTELNNTGFVPTNFLMRIYGACKSPCVTIGGHNYEVAVDIEANEFLTIDSTNKTILLTGEGGATRNCFNLRNKESYIFEKIPVGMSAVARNGEFKFDVVLLEERSEPKWT